MCKQKSKPEIVQLKLKARASYTYITPHGILSAATKSRVMEVKHMTLTHISATNARGHVREHALLSRRKLFLKYYRALGNVKAHSTLRKRSCCSVPTSFRGCGRRHSLQALECFCGCCEGAGTPSGVSSRSGLRRVVRHAAMSANVRGCRKGRAISGWGCGA